MERRTAVSAFNPLDTLWQVGEHVKDVVIDGQAVLVDTNADTYFGLDEVGTLIWDQLRESTTGVAIAAQIVQRYDVSAEVVCRDIERFLRELYARGLLVSSVGGA